MHVVASFLAFLACTTQGMIIQSNHVDADDRKQPLPELSNAHRALAMLLLASSNPSSGWQLTGVQNSAMKGVSSRVPHPALHRYASAPLMKLDLADKNVEREYQAVLAMDLNTVKLELQKLGVPVQGMKNQQLQETLVEFNLRKKQQMGKTADEKKKGGKKKKKTYGTKFEEIVDTKPAVANLYKRYKSQRMQNAFNLLMEYCNDPAKAEQWYGTSEIWEKEMPYIKAALDAKVEVKPMSGKFTWEGFPANMGEPVVRSTFKSFGELKAFTCEEKNYFLSGTAELGSASALKALVDKWDGTPMGMGVTMHITPDDD